MGVELIILPMLAVACIKALISMAVDAYVAIVHPDREAPSLARRRARVEIAQQQHQVTGVTGVGQAVADRLATRIANPHPRPAWWATVLDYFTTLLAEFFSQERRKQGKPTAAHCWICDTGHDGSKSGLCPNCELLTPTPCTGCGLHLLEADLEDGKCQPCRQAPASPPPPPVPPPARPQPAPAGAGPARMSIPAWLAEPNPTGRKS